MKPVDETVYTLSRLRSEVVGINSFFTTCTSVCPPMNRNFEKIQEALGDRLAKEAFLVSITVDPITDTPERLKEYSRRFHARASRARGPGNTPRSGGEKRGSPLHSESS